MHRNISKFSALAVIGILWGSFMPPAFAAGDNEKAELQEASCREAQGETDSEMGGARAFNRSLDHPNSRYYVINDYFNMKSGAGLHILSNFSTAQQNTEYTCGCTSALMVLKYYGIYKYNEEDIGRIIEVDPKKGTSVEGLLKLFEAAGLKTDYHADTKPRFDSVESCEKYIIEKIDGGIPIMVDWLDWNGHWQVIIGVDTCETESPYDDVLILADPYDITDHCQDGYYIFPYGRFFDMWREGGCAGKQAPYEQPFVTAFPPD